MEVFHCVVEGDCGLDGECDFGLEGDGACGALCGEEVCEVLSGDRACGGSAGEGDLSLEGDGACGVLFGEEVCGVLSGEEVVAARLMTRWIALRTRWKGGASRKAVFFLRTVSMGITACW